jgi:hypothetical protein
MASSTSSVSPTSNPIAPPSNYGQFVTVKLTHDNYLLWQAQILPYLRSQRLIGYVTGAIPCPSTTLPTADKTTLPVLNPAYEQWYEQDQVKLSALLSSLSLEVMSQCLFLKTSKQVWDKLDSPYAVQSQATAMQMRMQLATIKKHDLSASDYFDRVNYMADNLAAAGVHLHDDEVVVYLLTDLPEEYDSLVMSVTTRAVPMSLSEVYTNLLSFEMRLINHQGAPTPSPSAMANYASRGGRGDCHGGRSGGCGGGRNGGRTGFSASGGTARPRCQIYGRTNHLALQCWYRYDDNFRKEEKLSAAFTSAPSYSIDAN